MGQEIDGGAQPADVAHYMECKSLLWMGLSFMGLQSLEVRNMFCWFLNSRTDLLERGCSKGTAW